MFSVNPEREIFLNIQMATRELKHLGTVPDGRGRYNSRRVGQAADKRDVRGRNSVSAWPAALTARQSHVQREFKKIFRD